jgi:alanyl-tRNA synthetase
LPKPSVDTGAGLERLAAVLQNKISNFDTDLFLPLLDRAAELISGKAIQPFPETVIIQTLRGTLEELSTSSPSLRVIADHARAATFLINDGVIPGNGRREYVLRKIIRRAVYYGRTLGQDKPFLNQMIGTVCSEMGGAYPELLNDADRIQRIVLQEEEKFARTLSMSLPKLEQEFLSPESVNHLKEAVRHHASALEERELAEVEAEGAEPLGVPQFELMLRDLESDRSTDAIRFFQSLVKSTLPKPEWPLLSGEKAFQLYDTFGLPFDFIDDVARDHGMRVDEETFDRAMEEQRTRARASWKGGHKEVANPAYAKLADTFKTEPDFYFGTDTRDCRIEAIITKGGAVNEIKKGTEAEIVLDRTSIYSESGGQVADTGGLYDDSETLEVAEVKGAYYPVTGLIAHRIVAKEDLHVGDRVATVADAERRARNMRNHTATHLMNAALRNILGTHVKQAGSLVAPGHLRFDFSHFAAVDPSELADIEQQVNEEIRKNLEVTTDIMNIDDALASGALAFFDDKYPEANVRVVTMPDASSPRGFYSKELCGGTHVARTGAIGIFKIVAEQSTAAGIRRIEAISGDRALAEYQRLLATLRTAAGLLNASEDQIIPVLERQIDQARTMEKQLEALKRKAAGSQAQGLLDDIREVKGVRVLAKQVSGFDREALRQLVDSLRQKLGSGVIVLGAVEDGKVALITAVTKDLIPKLHAGKIVQEIAKLVGGSGGGRPDLAEAGGKDTSGLEKAIDQVYPLLDRLL